MKRELISDLEFQRISEEHRLTKYEAVVLARVRSQFSDGFTPSDLEESLGWPFDLVTETLDSCVELGLLPPPIDCPSCDTPHFLKDTLGVEREPGGDA